MPKAEQANNTPAATPSCRGPRQSAYYVAVAATHAAWSAAGIDASRIQHGRIHDSFVAHDPDGKVWSSYIVGGLPTTVVIAKGRIRYVGVGVDDAALDDAVAKALAAR